MIAFRCVIIKKITPLYYRFRIIIFIFRCLILALFTSSLFRRRTVREARLAPHHRTTENRPNARCPVVIAPFLNKSSEQTLTEKGIAKPALSST